MADVPFYLVDFLRLLFAGAVVCLFLFGLNQAYLALRFLMVRRRTGPAPPAPEVWPTVTVQLPVYNEPLVVERLLDAIFRLQYPAGMMDIQILDDSTDETSVLIDKYLAAWDHQRISVQVLRRKIRTGYKAGALAEADPKGELVAIFDADFTPDPDFLLRAVPHFRDPSIGCVQAAWGYLNRRENLFTRLQAIGLAGHFVVEQPARNRSGWMSVFNGTCGLWRTSAIREAGGWHTDTLTEDLDLSIRSQLAGWKMVYLSDLKVCGELPAQLSAVRTQQFRWSRGGAQTAIKLSGHVLRTPMTFGRKWQAFFQLNASAVWVFVLMAAIAGCVLSLGPLVAVPVWWPWLGWLSLMASAGFIFFHLVAVGYAGFDAGEFLLIPVFLLLAAGWSTYLTRAVAGGWFGRTTPFIRTPKTGGRYVRTPCMSTHGIPELLLGALVLAVLLVRQTDAVTLGFQVMLAAGCLCNGILLILPGIMRRNG